MFLKNFLAGQIILLFFMVRQYLLKNGKCYLLLKNTTVQMCQELHSELNLFSWLTGFSLPSVLFTCVLPLGRLLSYVSLNRPGKHCNSFPVQAKHSTPKLPIAGLL